MLEHVLLLQMVVDSIQERILLPCCAEVMGSFVDRLLDSKIPFVCCSGNPDEASRTHHHKQDAV